MSDDIRNDPSFQRFENHVRESLIPKIEDTNLFVSIVPIAPNKVDVKFAVELGLAIMYDKPIVAVIAPGTPIPEKLSRVVDRFVELDLRDPTGRERLVAVLKEMTEEMKGEEGQ